MIVINDTYISDDIADKHFVCDLSKCKGACCVEGDLGAPLEESELKIIEDIYPIVQEYMSGEGKFTVEQNGMYLLDEDGDYSTTTINGAECVFAIYDNDKVLKCAIEQAYLDGKTTYKKPISCHLYPIRIKKFDSKYVTVNYDRWSICAPACELGKNLKVPVYKFLKEPLIREFGEDWYKQLELAVENDNA
jgi:hypothetical protein